MTVQEINRDSVVHEAATDGVIRAHEHLHWANGQGAEPSGRARLSRLEQTQPDTTLLPPAFQQTRAWGEITGRRGSTSNLPVLLVEAPNLPRHEFLLQAEAAIDAFVCI